MSECTTKKFCDQQTHQCGDQFFQKHAGQISKQKSAEDLTATTKSKLRQSLKSARKSRLHQRSLTVDQLWHVKKETDEVSLLASSKLDLREIMSFYENTILEKPKS